jgi:hypothetical protein
VAEQLGSISVSLIAPQLTATNGPGRPLCRVDVARDQLLAGAGLAGHQHGGVAAREPLDVIEQHARLRVMEHQRLGTDGERRGVRVRQGQNLCHGGCESGLRECKVTCFAAPHQAISSTVDMRESTGRR